MFSQINCNKVTPPLHTLIHTHTLCFIFANRPYILQIHESYISSQLSGNLSSCEESLKLRVKSKCFRCCLMRMISNSHVFQFPQFKYIVAFILKNRAPVAQLIEHRTVMREVVSSTPAGPTLRVLK